MKIRPPLSTSTSFLHLLVVAALTLSLPSLAASVETVGVRADQYAQSGLIAQYDGIENAGAGLHDADATTWKDLLGDATIDLLLLPDHGSFNANALVADGTSFAATGAPPASVSAIDICYMYRTKPTSNSLIYHTGAYDSAKAHFDEAVGIRVANTGPIFYLKYYNLPESYAVNKMQTINWDKGGSSHTSERVICNGTNTLTSTGSNDWTYKADRLPGVAKVGAFSTTTTPLAAAVNVHGIRLYNRTLTTTEVAVNANIDRIRFQGADPADLDWPSGYDYSAIKSHLVANMGGNVEVSFDGKNWSATAVTNAPLGSLVTLRARSTTGLSVVWTSLPSNAVVSAEGAVTFKATGSGESPVAAELMPARAYVQSGLITQWDGIENAGVWIHDSTVTNWTDIIGDLDLTLKSKGSWNADGLSLSVNNGMAAQGTTATPAYSAIEVVYKMTTATGRILFCSGIASRWVLFDHPSGGAPTDIIYADASSTAMSTPVTIESTVVKSFSAVYSGNAASSVYTNGVVNASPGTRNNPWGIGDGKVAIGERAASSTQYGWKGEVYTIRLYSQSLTADEIAWNAMIDRCRYEGGALDEGRAISDRKVENGVVKIRSAVSAGANGQLVVAGTTLSSTNIWSTFGSTVTVVPAPAAGYRFYCWKGDTNGVNVAADGTLSFTVGRVSCVNATCYFCAEGSTGVARTWTGTSGDGCWETAGNWSPEGVPATGDDVTIATGARVVVSNATPQLTILDIAGTVACTNWLTCLNADNFFVRDGGKITVAGLSTDQATNRVWISCCDCTIAKGGSIDVNDLGFRGSPMTAGGGSTSYVSGPGKGTDVTRGASHGGHGAYSGSCRGLHKSSFQNVLPYDDPMKPLLPGSGGWPQAWGAGTAGGGAVYISAKNAVTVNGAIKASVTKTVGNRGSAGSGGAVRIDCATFHGTGGTISADGGGTTVTTGNIKGDGGYGGAVGGGGCIAIKYDATQQTDDMISGMTISAAAGLYNSKKAFGDETDRMDAGLGTLYFPDNKLLKDLLPHGLTGALVNCADYTWDGDLVFGKGYLRFANEGAKFKVDGNLAVTGAMTRLEIGGVTITNQCTVAGIWAGRQTNILDVTGAVAIEKGGRLDLRAAETNQQIAIGAYLKVGGELSIATNSTLSCWSDQVNMGSPFIEADSLRLDEGGLITGYMRGCGPGKGVGGGTESSGGSHGGRSGEGAWGTKRRNPYDDALLPVMPGSGGGNGSWAAGGPGGGVVYISVANQVTVNGTINVDGMSAFGSHTGGGGAGGTIHIRGRKFAAGSTALLSAKGGNGLFNTNTGGGSGGSGGRIAIWCGALLTPKTPSVRIKVFDDVAAYPDVFSCAATFSITGGVDTVSTPPKEATVADNGTLRFVHIRPFRPMCIIVR